MCYYATYVQRSKSNTKALSAHCLTGPPGHILAYFLEHIFPVMLSTLGLNSLNDLPMVALSSGVISDLVLATLRYVEPLGLFKNWC